MGFKTVSLVGVPLNIKTKTIGVLETVNKKDQNKFTETDLNILTALASHAAIAIENARMYESILSHADNLEYSVKQRIAELEERNQELTAYDRTVAHDLKNPLTVILGFTKILEMDYRSMTDTEIQDKLETISELGEKMISIIDELLFLSGIRDKEVELEFLDMGIIVKSAISSLSLLIEQHDARVKYPDRWPVAMGHAPWVEEVWLNYISNAIKYGGNPPCVELGAEEEKDSKVQFWVKDNGNGIDNDLKEQLFKSYTKPGKSKEQGHGLGLTIVKRIIEKLGGEVDVTSAPGEGCVFSFKLTGVKKAL